jgi:hypothetical protein
VALVKRIGDRVEVRRVAFRSKRSTIAPELCDCAARFVGITGVSAKWAKADIDQVAMTNP